MVRGDPANTPAGPPQAADNAYFGRYIAVMQRLGQDFTEYSR